MCRELTVSRPVVYHAGMFGGGLNADFVTLGYILSTLLELNRCRHNDDVIWDIQPQALQGLVLRETLWAQQCESTSHKLSG